MSEQMERARRELALWLADPLIDEDTKQELRRLDNAQDESELEHRFYTDLQFGTGGLRGLIGAGSNRMNRYTVSKATQAYANYLLDQERFTHRAKSVVIAYDSRLFSCEFALEAAQVLAGNGIVAQVFRALRPTPQLSFMVRHRQASGGIMVTASHNPAEYNGYKVYDEEGCQLVPGRAEQVMRHMAEVRKLAQVKRLSQAQAEHCGLLIWLDEAEDQAYFDAVLAMRTTDTVSTVPKPVQVVYTPLHGSGDVPVRAVLEQSGLANVCVVEEQQLPDGRFPTVACPNPEEWSVYEMAIDLAQRVGSGVVLATDPDADRLGVVVQDDDGHYVKLSGNAVGSLLLWYRLTVLQNMGKLPTNGIVVKSMVTSNMGTVIARHFGVDMMETLTGFKYIGEKMTEFEQSGSHTFLFGYEESEGYLAGCYARDKDAVLAALLMAECVVYYKEQGLTIIQVLHRAYEQFGYFQERVESRSLKGLAGQAAMDRVMHDFRERLPDRIGTVDIRAVLDYADGQDGLPKSNALKFILRDESWFCLRPSGTEPKLKIYFEATGCSRVEANQKLTSLVSTVMCRVDQTLGE